MAFDRGRMDESRGQLLAAAGVALGVYIEQEKIKGDGWRGERLGGLYGHLEHEVTEEIRINVKENDLTLLVHNAADAAVLSLMILARALEMSGEARK